MECLWQAKALTMRHGKKVNHLGRKSAHRKAMLRNMANSLIEHKKITTTVAKAKALRQYVEPILTKSKENTTHSFKDVIILFYSLIHEFNILEMIVALNKVKIVTAGIPSSAEILPYRLSLPCELCCPLPAL